MLCLLLVSLLNRPKGVPSKKDTPHVDQPSPQLRVHKKDGPKWAPQLLAEAEAGHDVQAVLDGELHETLPVGHDKLCVLPTPLPSLQSVDCFALLTPTGLLSDPSLKV